MTGNSSETKRQKPPVLLLAAVIVAVTAALFWKFSRPEPEPPEPLPEEDHGTAVEPDDMPQLGDILLKADIWLLPPSDRYKSVGPFLNGLAEVVSQDGYDGCIDTTGREVVPCIYTSIHRNGEDRLLVRLDGMWGLLDYNGEEIAPCVYTSIGVFTEDGLAQVAMGARNDPLFGYIDKTGREAIPRVYEMAGNFSHGLAVVGTRGEFRDEDMYGVINTAGELVVPIECEWACIDAGGMIRLGYFGQDGVLDREGREVVPPGRYIQILPFGEDGYAKVSRISGINDEIWGVGYIDRTGRETVPCIYNYVQEAFTEGLTFARDAGQLFGVINTEGEVVLPFIYEGIIDYYGFSDGLAVIRQGDAYGCIDPEGNVVVPFEYDFIDNDWWGYLNVTRRTEDGVLAGILDLSGREAVPLGLYDFFISPPVEGVIAARRGRKIGFYDMVNGVELTDCVYDNFRSFLPFVNGLAVVSRGGKWGYIDTRGREALPPAFNGHASSFSGGFAAVVHNGQIGILSLEKLLNNS